MQKKTVDLQTIKLQGQQNGFEEVAQDAFSRILITKDRQYVIEKINVEDEREVVYMHSAYENTIKSSIYNLNFIIKYWDAQINHKEHVFEVLRSYYDQSLYQYMKKIKKQDVPKQLALNFILELFSILAQIEDYGMALLGLKPTNIFVIEQDQSKKIQLKVGGFVRSDKFLLSKPVYQSQNFSSFVSQCISAKQYNIQSRYQQKSHAMCFSALLILVQFILRKDFEEISNIACWLNNSFKYKEGSMKLDLILDLIEKEFQGVRQFLEQAQNLLLLEEKQYSGILSMQIYTLATELNIKDNKIYLGDQFPLSQSQVKQEQEKSNLIQPNTKKAEEKQIKPVQKSKRCGGGFIMPKKDNKK